jgi:hypothetical protein
MNKILVLVLILLIFYKHLVEKFNNEKINKKKYSCGCGNPPIVCSDLSVTDCEFTIGCKLDDTGTNCIDN